MNGLCLASGCAVGYNTYESIRFVWSAKENSSGAYFCDQAEVHRENSAV